MAQITLDIDDATQTKLRDAAAQRQVSQSQFVADLIRSASPNQWPPEALALAGSVPDQRLRGARWRQRQHADPGHVDAGDGSSLTVLRVQPRTSARAHSATNSGPL